MDSLLIEVVKTVLAILTPVLTGLVVALLAKALSKAGLSLDAEKQARLEYLASRLVAQTEEWAAARIKAGMPTTAADKAEYYLSLAVDKLPGISPDEAHALAQQTLGRLKLGTTAVLSDLRVAASTGGQ